MGTLDLSAPGGKETLERIRGAGEELKRSSAGLVDLVNTGASVEQVLEKKEQFEEDEQSFLAAVSIAEVFEHAELAKDAESAKSTIAFAMNATIFSVLAALILAFSVGAFISGTISNRLTRLKNATAEISRGKLGITLETRVKDELGDPANAFNTMSADLYESRSELLAAKDFTDNIISSMDDMLVVVNTDRSIRSANRATAQNLGYEESELIGQHFSKILADRNFPYNSFFRNELSADSLRNLEAVFLTKDRQPIDVSVTSSALHESSSNEQGFVCLAQDITARKQVQEAMRASERVEKERAEETSRAKSEFLSRMSHELRTPLNAILGFGQLLQMDDTTPEQRESVDYILKAGRHLLYLIDEVLDIARIEEGKLDFSLEPVFVRDVLQESIDLVRPLAAPRNIEVKADLSGLDNCYVMADRQRLQQVLLNLIANAIKYNHEGGVVNVSCSELRHEAEGQNLQPAQPLHSPQDTQSLGKVRIEVSDTGPGLSPDKLARLFTPFERLGAEQGAVEGTGLGLALSKHLVEAMGGSIGVESQPGMGSTFWVELSEAEGHLAQTERMNTGHLAHTEGEEGARTVLYIEDNLSNLRLIERIMAHRTDFKLITAMQGQMGLDMAQEHRPDLILLDQHLPDMTGTEVLRRLREKPMTASIPVVVLSADANPRKVDTLLEAGAQAYLTKPLDVKKLLKALEEITVPPTA